MKTVREFYEFLKGKSTPEPMDETTMMLLMSFKMSGRDTYYEEGDEDKELEREFFQTEKHNGMFAMGFAILWKRMQDKYNLRLSYGVIAVLTAWIKGSPGNLVMLMAYLGEWARERNVYEINLDNFAMDVFPWGMWSEETLHEAWKLQKDGGANKLDYSGFYIAEEVSHG